jgi:polar amino acid transport system substrate-binding protein
MSVFLRRLVCIVGFSLGIFLCSSYIKADGATLRAVGQDIKPYYFETKEGKVAGVFVEIMTEVCQKIKITCEFKIVPFQRVLAMLKSGKANVAAPFGKTSEREITFVFSAPVLQGGFTFFGTKKKIIAIKKIEDAKGKTVGVHSSSATENSLVKINKMIGGGIVIVKETDVPVALKKALAGRYDRAYANRDIAQVWIDENMANDLTAAKFLADETLYRYGFPKKNLDRDLFNKFNKHLKEMYRNGHLKKILDKYKMKLPASIDE